MVSFAVEYQAAIDEITGDRGMGLRDYELSANEWEIVEQLSELLKVRTTAASFVFVMVDIDRCTCRFSMTPPKYFLARLLA